MRRESRRSSTAAALKVLRFRRGRVDDLDSISDAAPLLLGAVADRIIVMMLTISGS